MQNLIYITKATGESEPFDQLKLRKSLERAGAEEKVITKISDRIVGELKEGMTTKDIYTHAFELLNQEHKKAAVRYSLRKAIDEMGPTGFPFENLIAEILRVKGFEATTGYMAKGACAEHEIDITTWNNKKLIMIEAKFHNEYGTKSDLKVALYVNSRWEDLKNIEFECPSPPSQSSQLRQSSDGQVGVAKRKLDEGWLVTNTKFSSQAIKYAECRHMKLIGWGYPTQGNLQDLIEETGLHPITVLQSISQREKKLLMESGLVHTKQALENPDILKQSGLSDQKISEIFEEISLIQK